MNPQDKRDLVPSKRDAGFFRNILDELKLVWRLLLDRRVSIFLKVLPLGSLLYLLFPDFLIGPVDDTVVLGIGVYLFIELCPSEIVEEHRAQIRGGTPATDVVEAEFRDGPDKD